MNYSLCKYCACGSKFAGCGKGMVMYMQDLKKKDNKEGEEGAQYEILQKCLVIRIQEDLDHHNAVRIREKADRMIDRYQTKHIIFDFGDVNFMDSAGIGVVMGRYKKVIFSGGKAAVANVHSPVDRIFRLSGLYKIIEKYDRVEDAVNSLQKA